MKKETVYNIGIDIGTNSVGWAVTDQNFNLLKKGKNHLWGSRIFDGGETAKNRRLSRQQRRRYNKRRERIFLLQSIMESMINEVDSNFYFRLQNTSFLDETDKTEVMKDDYKANYNLFVDHNYTDKDFYNEFPTIYHLRHYLCKSQKKEDPRLIYLALHHMMKYRGNFLNEGSELKDEKIVVEDSLVELLMMIKDINEIDFEINNELIKSLKSNLTINAPKKKIAENCMNLFSYTSAEKQIYSNLFAGILGNQMNLSKLFSLEKIQVNDKDVKLKLSDSDYSAIKEELENSLDELVIELLNEIEIVHNWYQLQQILGEDSSGKTISEIMINKYDDHKKDLKNLKTVIKKYKPTEYNKIFRNKDSKFNNYYNYINHSKKTTNELFYKFLKEILKDIEADEVKIILQKIDNEKYLLMQNSIEYGVIPYQMQLQEMQQILKNQSVYYDVLSKNADKICQILEFRIPYYYGPLDGNEKFGWLKKKEGKEDERIYPWNHEDTVDVDSTAFLFIQRMLSRCTYLPNEYVMPKNSLTCNLYEVLSEINKTRINGRLIKSDVKMKLINDLFLKQKKVKEKDLIHWWKIEGMEENTNNIEITGLQKENEFASSLNVWIDFKKIFGDINDSNYQIIEKIAQDITVFNDKKIIKRRLKKVYDLDEGKISKILKLKYSGWSSLSEKLLTGMYADNYVSSSATILDVMKEKNLVLMEIINDDKLGYGELIQEAYFKNNTGSILDEVNTLACSPAVKKGIRQSLLVVKEICHYMGHNPANIFLEFARNEEEKKRTLSRATQLQNTYKNISSRTKEENDILDELNNRKDADRMDERLYLYFSQKGKCMYSNKTLDINNLQYYHIDHVLPQSLIKDDSLDNKVLVISKENGKKLDDLVLPVEIRFKQQGIWKDLYEKKLISSKKYNNLIRTKFDENTKEKFIKRQIVETRQITKHVANLLTREYSSTNVYAIRANQTGYYREKYSIPKIRDLNQYHHAHDAYIVSIIGLFIRKALPKQNGLFDYNQYLYYAKKKMTNHDKSGFVLNNMNYMQTDRDTGEIIWNPEQISEINKVFNYKDCYISRKLEKNDSLLFKITVVPSDKNSDNGKTKATVPVNKKGKMFINMEDIRI